ncbi:MAG: hypothetical protein NC087_01625 [Anaeroplasma bactoclasticum]|nr:hypothetical protein [Anaeroplasma bactoclasticum]
MKKINYRHWIMISFVLLSLLLIPFCFKYAHLRIWESLVDLKNSSVYYVNELFDLELKGSLSVNELTSLPFTLPFGIPNNWDEFQLSFSGYWQSFFSLENLTLYCQKLGDIAFYVSKILLIISPLFLILVFLLVFNKAKENNNYNEDTKSLVIFKKLEKKIYLPIKKWIMEFITFAKNNRVYLHILALIWAYNFNVISIVIEFLAFYLFFITCFKTITIYIQFIKLLMDMSVMINFIPNVIWVIFIYFVFDKFRKKIGYERLEHMELKNRGYINERPIVLMLNGTMGSKKTTMITDIALSQEIMFRDKAFELILENDLKFPFFPWINLENSLKRAINAHLVYNLATCRKFIQNRKRMFLLHTKKRFIFDYDFKSYGVEYNNDLCISDVWDVIENYAQLYFIYTIESSLLIANYSIRVDNLISDIGNFPMWNCDLFKNDVRLQNAYSRHSHIIDFDMLRLGKKLVEENEKSDMFEFGIINITEIGKERQNTIELRDIKKSDDFANQKNDLFNSWLKMIRHSATVDNFPFVKVIADDQRPESWGADGRELCEIIFIKKASPFSLAMPMFWLEDIVCNMLLRGFKKRYYNYRYLRGDNTLKMYLYHGFISKVNRYYQRTLNRFGYYQLKTTIESGRQDGNIEEKKYYLMTKKIYSKRFSTDAFSSFFNEKALRSSLGINDLEEFKSIKASFEEMELMNSYFFNDLIQLKDYEVYKK